MGTFGVPLPKDSPCIVCIIIFGRIPDSLVDLREMSMKVHERGSSAGAQLSICFYLSDAPCVGASWHSAVTAPAFCSEPALCLQTKTVSHSIFQHFHNILMRILHFKAGEMSSPIRIGPIVGKKRKLDDGGPAPSGSPSPVTFVRDKQIWFEDGNIVICVAYGTGNKLGFRCHGSVLASRSPVFATMLGLPNVGGEKIDGAACVDLPDSLQHVRSLLKFLYGFT